MSGEHEITHWLIEISQGSRKAYNKLFPLVYDQLRDIAFNQIAKEAPTNTLSRTDLVHEVYLKLVNQNNIKWKDSTHFFAIAARSMRQILIDHARKKKRLKRGGNMPKVTYIDEIMKTQHQAEDLLQIDKVLDKLYRFDNRMAKIVELHYFGEMNFDDIGKVLSISTRTVYRDWAKARGWLYKELKGEQTVGYCR